MTSAVVNQGVVEVVEQGKPAGQIRQARVEFVYASRAAPVRMSQSVVEVITPGISYGNQVQVMMLC